jgi:sporulation protein YlmC with PRC-barrel domain
MKILTAIFPLCIGLASIGAAEKVQSEATKPPAERRDEAPAMGQVQRATEILGLKARSAQDENLGHLTDLVLDRELDEVVFAVLTSGGFLGVGDKLIAVPPKALAFFGDGGDHLVIHLSKERLAQGPGFDRQSWPAMTDQKFAEDVHQYYGEHAYVPPSRHGIAIREPAGAPSRETPPENRPQPRSATDLRRDDPNLNRVSDLLGTPVRNPKDQPLGEIKDVVVDLQAGRVVYLVLGTGGFLGLGEKYFALPPTVLAPSDKEAKVLILNVDKERLARAPGFDKNKWPDMANDEWREEVYQYHQQRPYGQNERPSGRQVREPAGAPPRNEPLPDQETKSPTSQKLGKVSRASELIGVPVANSRDEHLGDIRDAVIDMETGRLTYLVLGAGTVLGLGGKYYAIPPRAFRTAPEGKNQLLLDVDKQRLGQAPGFDKNRWPDMADPKWSEDIHRFHQQRPLGRQGTSSLDHPEAAGTSGQEDAIRERGRYREEDTSGKLSRVTELLDVKVSNHHDQNLGQIKDIVLDLEAGRVLYLVLGSGGFVGLGEKYFALPPQALGPSTKGEKALSFNIEKERLASAPGFDKSNWPDMANPEWAEEVYRYHGQRPFWMEPRRTRIDPQEPAGAARDGEKTGR